MEEFTTCFQGTGWLAGGGARSKPMLPVTCGAACEPGHPAVPLEYKPPPVCAALGFGTISQSGWWLSRVSEK